MIKLIFGLVICMTFIYANPIVVTYIHEFQTAPDSLERIELHITPQLPGGGNLSGWSIRTRAGTAIINQGTILPPDGYLTIDSTNTSGIFNLNEIADTLSLYDPSGYLFDRVIWHSLPAGWEGAPAPPYGGSTSLYRSSLYYSVYWDRINWYIDSTPTFEYPNDDWSSISGRVLNAQGQPVSNRVVVANGPTGGCNCLTDSAGNYTVAGLGQGKYWVTVWHQYNQQAGNYPESVYVGYSQNVAGINITVPLSGIEQTNQLLQPDFSFIIPNPFNNNSKISFVLPYENEVLIKIYDTKGSLLKTLLNQKLNAGQHKIGLNLNPGVYFLNVAIRKQRLTKKLIVVK